MIAPLLAILAYGLLALTGCAIPETPDGGASESPFALVRRAARLTGTWSAADAADRYARFAALTTGGARRDATQAAAHLAHDRHLTSTSARQTSTILAIATDEHDPNVVYVISEQRLATRAATVTTVDLTIAHVLSTSQGLRIDQWTPQQ